MVVRQTLQTTLNQVQANLTNLEKRCNNLRSDLLQVRGKLNNIQSSINQYTTNIKEDKHEFNKPYKYSETVKELEWWQKRCCFCHQYHFLYFPIPKIASSSLKLLIIKCNQIYQNNNPALKNSKNLQEICHKYLESNIYRSESNSTIKTNKHIHEFCRKHLQLSSLKPEEALSLLANNDYFKFTVVRCPWRRLVSAYYQKFVIKERTPLEENVLRDIYGEELKLHIQRSISFDQFVRYVCSTEDEKLDVHWKPQHLFIQNIKLDFIGKFENLKEDYLYLKNHLNIPFTLPWKAKVSYSPDSMGDMDYSQLFPYQLREMESLPLPHDLYTVELVELVRQKFAKDIEMFGYSSPVLK